MSDLADPIFITPSAFNVSVVEFAPGAFVGCDFPGRHHFYFTSVVNALWVHIGFDNSIKKNPKSFLTAYDIFVNIIQDRAISGAVVFKVFAFQSVKTMNTLRNLSKLVQHSLRRNVCTTLACRSTYESDGKTSVTILNKEAEAGLMINSYSQFGFRLNNDMVVIGPMAIFSRTVLSWNVESHEDINDESLSLFCAIEPKIDVLVVGIGDNTITPAFSKKIIDFMKRHRINVEVLGTEQACSTFNFLNAEHRVVAAALIPPITMRVNEDDLMQKQISISKTFEVSDK